MEGNRVGLVYSDTAIVVSFHQCTFNYIDLSSNPVIVNLQSQIVVTDTIIYLHIRMSTRPVENFSFEYKLAFLYELVSNKYQNLKYQSMFV